MGRKQTNRDVGIQWMSTLPNRGCVRVAQSPLEALLGWQPDSDQQAVGVLKAAARLARRMGSYARARRYCREALRLVPSDAEIHYQYGCAYEEDPFGSIRCALRHYQKAVKLDAHAPLTRASLGRAMVRVDEIKSGIKVLKDAAAGAPADPEVLEIVSMGLREAGQPVIAFRILSMARFLAPNDTTVKQLWNQAKYEMAVQRQAKRNKSARSSNPSNAKSRSDAKCVPFLRIHNAEVANDEPQQPAAKTHYRNDESHHRGTRNKPHFTLRAYPAADR